MQATAEWRRVNRPLLRPPIGDGLFSARMLEVNSFLSPVVRLIGARAQAVAAGPLTEQQLVDYVAGGCKPKEKWRIGTEHEKFGFYKDDKRRIDYEAIRVGKPALSRQREYVENL